MDGTLFQTHVTSVAAVNRALTEAGLSPRPESYIASLFGEKEDTFYSLLAPEFSLSELDSLADKARRYEREEVRTSGQLFPGVVDMLRSLREEGHTLAICSNASLEYIEIVLDACGIRSYFTEVRGREEDKDKTAIVARMIRDGCCTIMVGDRKHDFIAAKNNHIAGIAALYGYGKDECGLADFPAEDTKEILYYIRWCVLCHRVSELIRQKKTKDRSFIAGISGVDTSGKTRFVSLLSRYLCALGYPVQCVHLDDFHHPAAIRNQLEDPVQSYIRFAFDMERLTEMLAPIRDGRSVHTTLPVISLKTDAFTEERRYAVTPDTVVLLEGVLLFRPPIDPYLDARIWLDIPFDEVLNRAESRDVPLYGEEMMDRYREKYIPVQQWFIRNHNPCGVSDMVIDNTDPQHPAAVL